jgi:hypothetical protein|tara:strand:- start:1200 stop:1358 length:159 start_codon:yes stop_codon:yes gene_type:complete
MDVNVNRVNIKLLIKQLDEIVIALKEQIIKYESENKALRVRIFEMKKFVNNK